MKKIAQKKQKTNVLNLADNPRFKRVRNEMLVPKDLANAEPFCLTMKDSAFGFAFGDRLICKRIFDENHLRGNTVVVTERNILTVASNAENIIGVVVAFQRDIVAM